VHLILTLIVGGIVGWLASRVMKTDAQMGILANIVVGIIGSWLGFWVAGLVGIAAYGAVGRFLVAVVGAILLIALLKGLKILK
jgi:uncharacterized membrane protein YeaQ/YmgE (transglycosylase-associated protein family)